jgi:hypothetical protein
MGRGLNSGAGDYPGKPSDLEEMVASVRGCPASGFAQEIYGFLKRKS